MHRSVRRFLPFLLGGLAGGLVAAPRLASGQAPTAAAADRPQLLRLEDGWAKALVKRDRSVFQRMLAPGFVYTEDAKLSTRDEVLRTIISDGDTVTAARNEDMAVHLSLGTGVVTGLLIIQGRSGGSAYVHRYRFTDTWVKQTDGGWKIYAAQDYLIRR
ncbi:MAG TPA: nuclear transport factor 2 family protein [Gemmatimonadaceae bacterium]|nr:nuclear transport factor 2 family protein [Gemmatimonadaceae bacterium]